MFVLHLFAEKLKKNRGRLYGCLYLDFPHTCSGLLTPLRLWSGIIYLLLLHSKADVASFDPRMLSVSWGAQFSAFLYI